MPDIVVTARVLPTDSFLSFFIEGGRSFNLITPFFSESPYDYTPQQSDPASTLPTVAVEDFVYDANVQALLQRLRGRIGAVSLKLGNVIPPTQFKGIDGKNIDYTGVYANLLHYDILITNPANDDQFSSKYGGELRNTVNGFVTLLKLSTLSGYDAHGQEGLNYLLFHEIAHTLNEVNETYTKLYREYTDAGGLPANFENSPQFAANERYANYVAREIARSVNEPIMGNPPYGYGE